MIFIHLKSWRENILQDSKSQLEHRSQINSKKSGNENKCSKFLNNLRILMLIITHSITLIFFVQL